MKYQEVKTLTSNVKEALELMALSAEVAVTERNFKTASEAVRRSKELRARFDRIMELKDIVSLDTALEYITSK